MWRASRPNICLRSPVSVSVTVSEMTPPLGAAAAAVLLAAALLAAGAAGGGGAGGATTAALSTGLGAVAGFAIAGFLAGFGCGTGVWAETDHPIESPASRQSSVRDDMCVLLPSNATAGRELDQGLLSFSMAAPSEVTQLLVDWQNGSPEALQRLIPLVYGELRAIAGPYLSQER